MVNLNECKFGDRFKTRGGRMAIFLHKSITPNVYICIIENTQRSHLEMKFWATASGTSITSHRSLIL